MRPRLREDHVLHLAPPREDATTHVEEGVGLLLVQHAMEAAQQLRARRGLADAAHVLQQTIGLCVAEADAIRALRDVGLGGVEDLVGILLPAERPASGVCVEFLLVHALLHQAPLHRLDPHAHADAQQILAVEIRGGLQLGRAVHDQEREGEGRARGAVAPGERAVEHAVSVGVLEARLAQQRARGLEIEGPGLDRGIMKGALRRVRSDRHLAEAFEDVLDDARAVQRERHRASHTAIAEERSVRVPAEIEVTGVEIALVPDAPVEEGARGPFGGRELLEATDLVAVLARAHPGDGELVRLQLEQRRVRIGPDAEGDLGDRRLLADPVLVALEADLRAGLVRHQPIGPGADHAAVVVPVLVEAQAQRLVREARAVLGVRVEELGHDRQPERGLDRAAEGLLPAHDELEVVQHLDALQIFVVVLREAVLDLGIEQQAHRERDVARAHEVLAAQPRMPRIAEVDVARHVPAHARAQVDRERAAFVRDLDALRQLGLPAIGVAVDLPLRQGREHVGPHAFRDVRRVLQQRVEALRIRPEPAHETAAFLRAVCAQRALRCDQEVRQPGMQEVPRGRARRGGGRARARARRAARGSAALHALRERRELARLRDQPLLHAVELHHDHAEQRDREREQPRLQPRQRARAARHLSALRPRRAGSARRLLPAARGSARRA